MQNVTLSSRLTVNKPLTPFQRLLILLREDKKDLWILVLYTVLAGLLTLTIPLAAQALVNTIAAGVFLQSVAVLTVLLFAGMIFAGVLKTSQFYITEVIQQRAFARVALRLAERVPIIQHQAINTVYPPELLNRFFDVILIQKTLSKLLLDGPVALLQVLVGLILMAFYSPILLGFDLLILIFIAFIVFVLGRNSVTSSLNESVQKYRVAAWLQEVARCQSSLKVDAEPAYLFAHADTKVVNYLHSRRSHFRILFRQVIANYFFQAIASAGILGIGGWLVINRQLTLGQLVASELVIIILLSAMDKLVTMFQDWYDLLTAVEKIAHITNLPTERVNGKLLSVESHGMSIVGRDVSFAYTADKNVFKALNFSVLPGEKIALVGCAGAGKSTFAAILCGFLQPTTGAIQLQDLDLREIDLSSLRHSVAWLQDSNEVFDGTFEENIVLGRHSISQNDIERALKIAQLVGDVASLPEGMQTRLVSAGGNLSKGQIQKLMIARAVIGKPKLLILDTPFTGIDENTKLLILDALLDSANPWTVINITNDRESVIRCNRVMVLSGGNIVEMGSPQELVHSNATVFLSLFPSFSEKIMGRLG